MGARPSSFRKSGGFLNGVVGKLVSYQWTDEFNGKPFVAGRDPRTKKERFHSLYFVPTVLVDGADEPVTTTLFAGGYDDFEVSEDGLTITPVVEGQELGGGTAFAKLISSVIHAGFPEDDLPEDVINYEAMVGWRFGFVQQTNAEDTKKLGKRVDPKTKREYDRQDLLIDQAFPPEDVAAPSKSTKKPAAAAKPAPGTKGKPKVEEVDIDALTTEFMQGLISELKEGESLPISKLSMRVLQGMKTHPNREEVRTRIFEPAFLETQAGWVYNAKKRTVAAE